MDIEKLATSAVEDSISRTDVLSPLINEGDKEPSWDGNIYIYENEKKNKKGIKKVPVQVKGKVRKNISSKKMPKFSVSFTDLDNWLNDGGIILFVVLLDESGTQKMIYYSALLPVLIRNLKKTAKGKKSLCVPLKPFPSDNNKKVEILINFYNNKQKQTSFATAQLYTIDELQKQGLLEYVSFPIMTYGKRANIQDIESLIFQNDIYWYASIKGSSIPQPLPEIPMDLHIAKDVIAPVKVNERVFYDRYRIVSYAGGFDLHIGKSTTLKIVSNNKKMIVNFKANGYLKDYIHDTEFILAIIENREMTINGAPLKFCDLEGINLESDQQKLLYYREVQKMLDLLGAKTDLDCNNLSDQDVRNIRNITNAIVHGKEMKFPGSTSNAIFWRFKIANLELLIWADKVSDNGYRLQSFFSDHQIVLFELSDKKMEKPYPITHYVLMKKNDFVHAANIDYGRIVADLSRTDTSPVVADRLVLFMLEMLKAYDEQEKKDEELYRTIEHYCNWLMTYTKGSTDIMTLNWLQIIKRKRDFKDDEVQLLQDLRKGGHDWPVRCGANILLGKMESAQDCFDEMGEKEKKDFLKYPICFFGKPHYIKTEESNNG